MDTIGDLLVRGWQYHQSGNLDLAQQLYRRVLQLEPRHANAMHLLGRAEYQLGHLTSAYVNAGTTMYVPPARMPTVNPAVAAAMGR